MQANDIPTLVAWIQAELLFTGKTQHVYYNGKDFYLQDRLCADNTPICTFGPKDTKDMIYKRVKYEITKLIEGGRIPSSLGKSLPVMRMNMDDE